MNRSDSPVKIADLLPQAITLMAGRPVSAGPSDEAVSRAAAMLAEQGYDDHAPSNFLPVAKYLAALGERRPAKGLALFGEVGTGKTMAARIMARTAGLRFCHAKKLAKLYQDDPEAFDEVTWGDRWGVRDVVIDDLGSEPTVNDYGTRLEVLEHAITGRYTAHDRKGALTIITSNLKEPELVKRYGHRTVSRIKGMCNVVVFDGPDRRLTGNEEWL